MPLLLFLRLLLSATLLTMASCAQQTPLPQSTPVPIPPAKGSVCPQATIQPPPPTLDQKRYLDRMAIIDAQKDFTQAPEPGYVLDADSVVRFPRIEPIGIIFIGDSILTG
ncbi:MAG: acyltransferase, partial [Acidithiobacillus sp.]